MIQRLRYIAALAFAATSFVAAAQIKISGKVVDKAEKPIKGANVYLDNTIDGGTSDSLGNFTFTTTETGSQTLVATEISHENMGLPLVLVHDTSDIVLHMNSNKVYDLDVVTITAGSFDASNDKTKTVLKPLDIVTTAGSNGDIVKAMQMLPGTQQPGTENGLFIRGGDAAEAAILVDETVVQSAFVSGPPGLATRSRFGAFQFQGMSFSSGGYSAKYGQALSGVLGLTSNDLPDKSNVNLGINIAGVYASGTKRWKNSSFDIGGNYSNISPLLWLASNNFSFYKVPVSAGANARYVWTPNKNGIFKATFTTTYGISGIGIPNPAAGSTDTGNIMARESDPVNFVTKNTYYFGTASYKQMYKNKYMLYTAASYSYDKNDNSFGQTGMKQNEYRGQFRIEGKKYISGRMNLLLGTELQRFGIEKNISASAFVLNQEFEETQAAVFTELEWTPIYWLAVKPGLRYEHSALLNADKIAPRFSAAIKTTRHSQASLAGGIFYQNPGSNYLLSGFRPGMQTAIHYIANWQWTRTDRTLRLEGYYKSYQDLVRENVTRYDPNRYRFISPAAVIDNSGNGYAQGLELFWRDKKSIKNADYWVSYSYIDTRRLYENFLASATPTFIAKHNVSLVGKYFVTKWNTNFSATYSFASGYPYFDPNKTTADFLKDKTPVFNNTALTVAYLHSFRKWFTVFYLSVDNVLNTHNIYGYRFKQEATGYYTKTPIVPGLYRTIFFGVNASLTQFKKDEL
ncbi:MAG: carboxypeptidase-like regulatory domain-containing protein [Taibaiella sp.]|nr:carboxypeptidase-like regulatory domain-containing protein [Taibaiella sp.]